MISSPPLISPIASQPTSHTIVTLEKVRGVISGSVAGTLCNVLTVVGVTLFGLSPVTSMIIMHYVVGAVIGYVADILIAKRSFHGVDVPYSALGVRFAWLLRSLGERFLFRFVISIVIEALTAIVVFKAVRRAMDDAQFLATGDARVWRDLAASACVALLTYVLFGNVLRYDWAFNEKEDPLLNATAMIWIGLALMLFASTRLSVQDIPMVQQTQTP